MGITFTMPGKPVGKQRPRIVRNAHTGKTHSFTPEKTKDYEKAVARAYRLAGGKLLQGGIAVNIIIFVKKSKTSRLTMPTKKPDIDNVLKTILDGLNGIAYRDDSQVIKASAAKFYSENDYVSVSVSEAEDDG